VDNYSTVLIQNKGMTPIKFLQTAHPTDIQHVTFWFHYAS